ncbi:hypothetical protein ITJ66_06115 [Plantibacter sp. VKM Ac-2885]|uniref:hypothetical protein n=1 Tax=unclassified Plantibacter TaxID=2624265 RepID=UPI00188AA378|nr:MULTISPECIES: hypothetical protein [unclassified Plantibacter]MBD8536649.1 hypothetical protein [Plantibacter sp. CFBP 13570]MBF4512057.1 hypothetical protein [Plantibacter sp. VKM Ac-2885]
MGLIQDVGGGLLLALGLLLAGLVVFLVLALGTQYVRMRRRRPRGKEARADAELRAQLLDEGFTTSEAADAIRSSDPALDSEKTHHD